jgi:vacuolar-type H+-ATPase subunit I/STV1
LYAQLLIGVSFAVAAYQDVTDRAVNDLVWVPSLAGAVFIIYSMVSSASPDFTLEVIKLGLVGAIAFVFTFFGAVGQADAIALIFVAADPYPLSPFLPLFSAAVVALSHIGYEYMTGNARGGKSIPLERFLKEKKWIPKAIVANGVRTEVSRDVNVAREEVEANQKQGAMVEVSYGVPTVAYLGVGYIAYLAYLVLFNQAAFISLP